MVTSSSAESFDQVRQRLANWDFHFDIVRQRTDITQEDKMKILEGMEQLRIIMGNEWLKEVVETGHPIMHTLINEAPCARYQLADLGKKLIMLSDVPNFERLKQRLIGKEQNLSATAELEIAAKMKTVGFDIELYPRTNSKESDLKVNVDRQEYFIEITVMHAAEEERKAYRTLDDLTMPFFMDSRVRIAGKIYKTLSVPSIRRLQGKIKRTISQAIKENRCIEISEPRVIDYFICLRNKENEIREWLKKKGFIGTIEGPPVNVDEPRRIRRKIEEEYRQLPKNKPGLIVIYGHYLVLGLMEDSYRKLADLLEETIYDHPRLIGGVIVSSYISVEPPEIKVKETPSYVFRCNFDANELLQEDVLIIKNKYPEFPINEKLLSAF